MAHDRFERPRCKRRWIPGERGSERRERSERALFERDLELPEVQSGRVVDRGGICERQKAIRSN